MDNPPGASKIRSDWSENKIRALLAAHEFSYQRVELPYGLSTGGVDRSPTANLIYPESLAGKSVFDVGCMYGYFLFEAEERGAARMVGCEINSDSLAKCRLLASMRQSRAEFVRLDIDREELPGSFDYVLCLNLLHHLRNPLAALDKLIAATRECLVLEVASLNPRDSRKIGLLTMLGSPFLARLPVFFLAEGGKGKGAGQTFFITENAIHTLLKKHRQDFATVKFYSGGQKGRFIVVARKRRIGHLHIIAGVNAVGKTTFLDSWASGKQKEIAGTIGLESVKPWLLRSYGHLTDETEPDISHLLLQYNISQHLHDGDLHRHDRGLLDIIRCAEKTTISTLWHPSEKLLKRYQGERIKSVGLRTGQARKKIKRLLKLYGNKSQFDAVYSDWFAFTKRHAQHSHVILQEPHYRAVSLEDWESEFKIESSSV
jgi:SAM-dependent methyltransferase